MTTLAPKPGHTHTQTPALNSIISRQADKIQNISQPNQNITYRLELGFNATERRVQRLKNVDTDTHTHGTEAQPEV